MPCKIVPIAFDKGASKRGCAHAPHALLAGGLLKVLQERGQRVSLVPFEAPQPCQKLHSQSIIPKAWKEVVALTRALSDQALAIAGKGLPVFLGGDHSLSAGSISGMARYGACIGRPLFVLWLDAHPDFNTLKTTQSGNLHGVPLAYISGQSGFSGLFPPLEAHVEADKICILGVRSVDRQEKILLDTSGVEIHPMSDLHLYGLQQALTPFLNRVKRAGGLLHVSFDVDFLDPKVAGGVGTPVPDGANLSQANEIIDMIADSGLLSAVDIVEYNPELDPHGQTLSCVVELACRLIEAGTKTQEVRVA